MRKISLLLSDYHNPGHRGSAIASYPENFLPELDSSLLVSYAAVYVCTECYQVKIAEGQGR